VNRSAPLQRSKPLPPGRPLERTSELGRTVPLEAVKNAPTGRARIRPVSKKRAAQNRERRAMINALYPERPRCVRPGCPRMADDIHEPLTRARGGSITDPGNQVPLCRPCHDEVTFAPESTLGWAYDVGLLVHSWDAGKPRDAA